MSGKTVWRNEAARLQMASTGDGRVDGIAPDDLTYANVMNGKVKNKTIRKNKLHVLCANLLDHVKDLKLQHEEPKEVKVEKAKVDFRLEEELELKDAFFFVGDNASTNGGGGGELELKETTTTVKEDPDTPKLVKLAKRIKLAKSTDMWCLSPLTPLSQEARDKPRKVC
jgi:hypothetical protein